MSKIISEWVVEEIEEESAEENNARSYGRILHEISGEFSTAFLHENCQLNTWRFF